MKKAQWKADPRTRAFGMDPRELRIRELEGELHALKETNELWRYKAQHYQNEVNTREDKMGQLYQYRAAYKVLALTGVVLEHEGEFKHLKGDDMHEFFGIKEPPPITLRGAITGRVITDDLMDVYNRSYQQALVASMRQTKEAMTQNVYQVWMDEMVEAKNGSNSRSAGQEADQKDTGRRRRLLRHAHGHRLRQQRCA